jgi:hypothetical protein
MGIEKWHGGEACPWLSMNICQGTSQTKYSVEFNLKGKMPPCNWNLCIWYERSSAKVAAQKRS